MTKNQLSQLLERYPPGLRYALAADSTLLANEQYLAPYPALAGFLKAHPEVARDPRFYLDQFRRRRLSTGLLRSLTSGEMCCRESLSSVASEWHPE